MGTMLFRNAAVLATMDAQGNIFQNGSIYVEDNVIRKVGPAKEVTSQADVVIDASNMVILPGLVNCHHHLFQTLTRNVPQTQNLPLFEWLLELYGIWSGLDSEMIYVSSLLGFAELVLSGATTTLDHLYLVPHSHTDIFQQQVLAAKKIGIRFHLCRGSMSLGRREGGLPPDELVETEDDVIAHCRSLIESFHEQSRYGMIRISLGPCSPFSVTPQLLESTRQLAEEYRVSRHTHLAETRDETEYCMKVYGKRPLEYMADVGWTGEDVSFAHGVHFDDAEIAELAASCTGVVYCPTSNMRLGSGIAPICRMLRAGVKVGLGVDGSASNDSSNMLGEVRMGMLLQRVAGGAGSIDAASCLKMGTSLGAAVLGRQDIGSLEVGKAADLVGINLKQVCYAGALHDPIAALVFCSSPGVDFSVINGEVVVEGGRITGVDVEELVQHHNELASELIQRQRSS